MSKKKKGHHGDTSNCLIFKRIEGVRTNIIVGNHVFPKYVAASNWLMKHFPEECKTQEDVDRLYAIRNMTKRAIVRAVSDGLENDRIEGDTKELCLSVMELLSKYMESQHGN